MAEPLAPETWAVRWLGLWAALVGSVGPLPKAPAPIPAPPGKGDRAAELRFCRRQYSIVESQSRQRWRSASRSRTSKAGGSPHRTITQTNCGAFSPVLSNLSLHSRPRSHGADTQGAACLSAISGQVSKHGDGLSPCSGFTANSLPASNRIPHRTSRGLDERSLSAKLHAHWRA